MFYFSEDMLPRHFPKVHLPNTKQLDETRVSIPQPTLPSASLILERWKEDQHRAKSVKKQVRFAANTGRHKMIGNTESFDIRRNLMELNFFEPHQKDRLYQPYQPNAECVQYSPFQLNFQKAVKSEGIEENCFARSHLPSIDYHQKPIRATHPGATGVRFIPNRKHRGHLQSLLNILEEQQRHIAIQQNQILIQEKQSLEQQKQICMLECQIEKLLLQNEAELDTTKTENVTLQSTYSGCEMSTGFIEDLRRQTTLIEKMIFNVGLSNNKSHDQTVRTVESSSFDFEFDDSGNTNTRINCTAQATICETSTNCDSYKHSQIAMERSFVLNMLGVKYKCSEDDGSMEIDSNSEYCKQRSSKGHNEFSEAVPLEMHDYLVRHGLINSR